MVTNRWDELEPVGVQRFDDGGPALELANCPLCKSTLAREAPPTELETFVRGVLTHEQIDALERTGDRRHRIRAQQLRRELEPARVLRRGVH